MKGTSNGNGRELAAQDQFSGLPPWMAKMRRAAVAAVSDADIQAIVRNQVSKAKEGDANAIRFVFDEVLGAGGMKGATFIQNNYPAEDAKPADINTLRPGSKARIELMRRRVESGNGAVPESTEPDLD